jgi:MinD superfamily P-loop ATPase
VAAVLMESFIVDAVGTGLSSIASVDEAHPILRITTPTTQCRRIAELSPT